MRDYLNSNERNQFMVLQSIPQLIEGGRNEGMNRPEISTMLEELTIILEKSESSENRFF
ncbi:hypothetical protein ACNQFZ_20805 [Schinkia sp. CFF1]